MQCVGAGASHISVVPPGTRRAINAKLPHSRHSGTGRGSVTRTKPRHEPHHQSPGRGLRVCSIP